MHHSPELNPRPAPAAIARKVRELSLLEARLLSASARALDAGFLSRAASYSRQVAAVRRERDRWALLRDPAPPTNSPYLFTATLALFLPLVDLALAGGLAARRLARVFVASCAAAAAAILGTSPNSRWLEPPEPQHPPAAPAPWTKEIAEHALSVNSTTKRIVPIRASSASIPSSPSAACVAARRRI